MKLYKKEGNILQILSFPTENAEKGDYLLVEDADACSSRASQEFLKNCYAHFQTEANQYKAKT